MTAILVLLTINTHILAQEADQLVYMTEEYRPYNYTENGELKGISVDLLRLMWAKMRVPEQAIRVLPWARGYQYVQTRKNHVLFAMSRTKEREAQFKWVGPLYKVTFVLIAGKAADITIQSIEDAGAYRIGTIREDVSEQILVAAGVDIDRLERGSDMAHNLSKLQTGRLDLLSYSQKGFDDLIEIKGLDPVDFKTVFIVKENESYYAFHRDTSDTLIQKFQGALGRLAKEHQAILEKYLGE